VVLDSQLLLTRESPLDERARGRIASLDGGETQVLGDATIGAFRGYIRPGAPLTAELRALEVSETLANAEPAAATALWHDAIAGKLGWEADESLLPLGQDACLAAPLAKQFVTVGGVVNALRAAVVEHVSIATEQQPLGPRSPLAESHGTL